MDRILVITQDEDGTLMLAYNDAIMAGRVDDQPLQPGHAFLGPRLFELANERPGTVRRFAFHRRKLGRQPKPLEAFLRHRRSESNGDRRVELHVLRQRSIDPGRPREDQTEHSIEDSGAPY